MKFQKTSMRNIEEFLHFQADILNNILDCIIVADLEGKIVYWNNGAEKLYGYSAKEVLGQSISILYLDQDNTNFKRDFENTEKNIRDGNEVTGIFQGRKKDGSFVLTDFRRNAMKNEEGNLLGFISVSRDITEQKKLKKHLVTQKSAIAQLLILHMIGKNGLILIINLSIYLQVVNESLDILKMNSLITLIYYLR